MRTVLISAAIVLALVTLCACDNSLDAAEINIESGHKQETTVNGESGEHTATGELIELRYHPGYGDMNGGYHGECLKKGENGEWIIESENRNSLDEPEIKIVYSVKATDQQDFEAFIKDKNVASLMNNEDSDEFVTDYSPWNYSIVYADPSSASSRKRIYVSFGEYQKYSEADYELIKELRERFDALKGEVLSETIESEAEEIDEDLNEDINVESAK